jgi:hypothetical protein
MIKVSSRYFDYVKVHYIYHNICTKSADKITNNVMMIIIVVVQAVKMQRVSFNTEITSVE